LPGPGQSQNNVEKGYYRYNLNGQNKFYQVKLQGDYTAQLKSCKAIKDSDVLSVF